MNSRNASFGFPGLPNPRFGRVDIVQTVLNKEGFSDTGQGALLPLAPAALSIKATWGNAKVGPACLRIDVNNVGSNAGKAIEIRSSGVVTAHMTPLGGANFNSVVSMGGGSSSSTFLISGSDVSGLTVLTSNSSGVVPAVSITPIWINAGTQTALLVNPTSVISGASSLLADFQVGSVSKFKVDKTGILTLTGQVNGTSVSMSSTITGTDITAGAANSFIFSGRSRLKSSADGLIELFNNAASDFTRLNFGGVTSSFPAIGRNGIFLEVLAADGAATASLAVYNTKTSGTNFERVTHEWNTNVARIWTEKGSGGGTARALVLGADATELLRFGSSTTLSFFAQTAVARQTGGENVTNSVTDSGSTAGTIPDITDGVVYANDYTNLRRALFQIARMLKQDHDALRAYGLLT